jgi:hypothetical protein
MAIAAAVDVYHPRKALLTVAVSVQSPNPPARVRFNASVRNAGCDVSAMYQSTAHQLVRLVLPCSRSTCSTAVDVRGDTGRTAARLLWVQDAAGSNPASPAGCELPELDPPANDPVPRRDRSTGGNHTEPGERRSRFDPTPEWCSTTTITPTTSSSKPTKPRARLPRHPRRQGVRRLQQPESQQRRPRRRNGPHAHPRPPPPPRPHAPPVLTNRWVNS